MDLKTNAESTKKLVDCAMGRLPADLVIRKGQWVSVQSGEIIPDTDIAVYSGRIAYVGQDASHTLGPQTIVVEANGRFLVPGLMDGHMHVESGMLTVTEFVRAVIPHGTTAMFVDPHEIANIFGLKGVRLMVDEAGDQPIHVFVQAPSCVPSAPGFETPGASITPADVAEMMEWPGIVGLGEMMNFPGVFNSLENVHAEMAATRAAGKVIGGHYASPDMGLPFHGYVVGGAEDDHEGTTLDDAIQRARQGEHPLEAAVGTLVPVPPLAGLLRNLFLLALNREHLVLQADLHVLRLHAGELQHDSQVFLVLEDVTRRRPPLGDGPAVPFPAENIVHDAAQPRGREIHDHSPLSGFRIIGALVAPRRGDFADRVP